MGGGWSTGFSLIRWLGHIISPLLLIATLFTIALPKSVTAQTEEFSTFSSKHWTFLEKSIDRGLVSLSKKQNEDGSFGVGSSQSQPALTAFATMAYLSRGHQPGHGPYGHQLERAIDYVLSTQDRYGFFSIDPSYRNHGNSYSHAISGMMLAEVLGLAGQKRNERIAEAIRRGLVATVKLQQRHAQIEKDRGGWRYIKRREGNDADLSVSTWHILFLRAAKNAGYDVPESLVAEAGKYVKSCYRPQTKHFSYLPGRDGSITMTGAGILSMFLVGQFDDPAVEKAVQTLADYDFSGQKSNHWPYYTCYHCSQAAIQVGGKSRNTILLEITSFLLDLQLVDGSWPPQGGAKFAGKSYATSMAILSLTPSYQILPIYQQ